MACRWRRGAVLIASIFLMLLVGGCKEEVYTGLTEREANDMLALLLRHGIEASKTTAKEGDVTVSVEQSRIADAIDLLRTFGFPREQFSTVGTIFQKQGLVSSPTEDHIRLVYALSQELNDTLSRIDGVLSARVHVVMPQPSVNNTAPSPSSAAVFIRYQQTYDLAQLVSQIKTLVANSIEGLSYDNVSVALFPVQIAVPPEAAPDAYDTILNIDVAPSSREPLLLMLGGLGGLCVILLGACAGMFVMWRRRRRDVVPRRQGSAA